MINLLVLSIRSLLSFLQGFIKDNEEINIISYHQIELFEAAQSITNYMLDFHIYRSD
jgi:hypothetical protein